MASDYEDAPETPVVTRRLVKLNRKKKQSDDDKHEPKSNNKKTDYDKGKEKNKLADTSARLKALDVSKLFGKMKNPSNYSGFISSSSFTGTTNGLKNWKTESLFAEDDEDEVFPNVDIEKEIKKKKEIQREKKKEKERQLKEKEAAAAAAEREGKETPKESAKSKPKSKAKSKPTPKSTVNNSLISAKATKVKDSNPPVYPSSSPEKEESPIRQESEPEEIEPEPEVKPVEPVKKRGRPQNTTEDKPKTKPENVAKPVKPVKPAKIKEPVKTTKKRKVTEMESESDETPVPENKKTTKKTTDKKKFKKEESSLFSLFEVLDIDDSKGKEDDDEVFVLDSPVKKTKKKKLKTSKEAKPKETKLKTKSKSKSVSRSKSPIEQEPNSELYDDGFNDFAGFDANLELERQQVEEEEKLLKELEQQEMLAEIAKHEKEEKQRQKQEREEQLKQQKLEKERQKQERLELKSQHHIKQQKKKKKLETLNRLKESISSVMNNKNVETVMIPLKNDDNDTSNNNIKLRRSSLNARGRRLSSVGNGFTAIPHDDIPIKELHKHIDLTLPDSHKLKQLLVWISKRLIKQGWNREGGEHNEDDEDVKNKGTAICKIILEEFVDDLIQGRVDIDWWGSSKASASKSINEPIIVHKNKANVENENKLEFYDNELKKLQRETKIWQELKVKNMGAEYDVLLKEIQSTRQPTQVSNADSHTEETKLLESIVNTSNERTDKFERLVHRLDVSNELIQRIMSEKNRLIAQKLKEQSQIDVLRLLRGLK